MTDCSDVPLPSPVAMTTDTSSKERNVDGDGSAKYSPESAMMSENNFIGAEEQHDDAMSIESPSDINGLKRRSVSPTEDEPLTKKSSSEFDKLWNNVQDNSSDFIAWTTLLQYVDQQDDMEQAQQSYDCFLQRYPYCYGYWKKYADFERRKGTKKDVLKVFSRGLEAIPLSTDLWIHYLDYVTLTFSDNTDYVREQFDAAIATCGLEFRSNKLWEAYINWESSAKQWSNITKIYEKLLGVPILKYTQHWQKFEEHVKSHSPAELLDDAELILCRHSLVSSPKQGELVTSDEAPPGVEAPKPDVDSSSSVDDTEAIQNHILREKRKIYDAAVSEAKLRWSYEEAIKRPYFHVKPLEKSQLSAWRSYVDFEISQGNEERSRILFERCLIACALYEEFWHKYIRYLEGSTKASEDEIRAVYTKMCTVHLRDRLHPHLLWAAFEEDKGHYDRALKILRDIQGTFEDSIETHLYIVGIYRRHGDINKAKEVFLTLMEKFKNKDDLTLYTQLAIKYARFLNLFLNDVDGAATVLQEVCTLSKKNASVLLSLVDIYITCRPVRVKEAAETLKIGTEAGLPPGSRLMFARRYLHFVTEYGEESGSVMEGQRLLYKVQKEVLTQEKTPRTEESMKQNGVLNTSKQRALKPKAETDTGQTDSESGHRDQQDYSYPPSGYPPYNQGYGQGYGGPPCQSWGYPTQQGNYGYGQGWGNYSGYYGQR